MPLLDDNDTELGGEQSQIRVLIDTTARDCCTSTLLSQSPSSTADSQTTLVFSTPETPMSPRVSALSESLQASNVTSDSLTPPPRLRVVIEPSNVRSESDIAFTDSSDADSGDVDRSSNHTQVAGCTGRQGIDDVHIRSLDRLECEHPECDGVRTRSQKAARKMYSNRNHSQSAAGNKGSFTGAQDRKISP